MGRNLRDLAKALRFDSAFWRRTMVEGVRRGPDAFVRYSPPLIGLAFGAALPAVRDRVRTNLRRVLGPRPYVQEMADVGAVFANYASCLTEAMLLGTERGHGIVAHARGVEHYEACMAEGKGLIIATAHTGGWEAAGPMMSKVHPGEVVVVMARERDERARALQDELRERAGVRVVHIGETALDALPLLRHLKTNAVVAMQIDRVPPGMRAREVTLFGAPWQAPEGPLTIAALSGAPIMPVFTRRMGFLEYELVAHPPIRLPRKPSGAELDAAAQQMMDAMGAFLEAHPTQWFHFS
ncbi:lysophospholipid acyltransferase family protein [Polyangium aurulentum]|uniref:lysophospholipid acyltransferase family protein n=1 Tax=Polyangium aurulentum TaxID=2567896 RepID=UPI001F38E2F5|nr:lysophospholipid acyltransferase family protein [Polyangium aurulentum]